MADLPESAVYDVGVYQLEVTDQALAGPDGILNRPLKNLTNRTAWLKAIAESLLAGKLNKLVSDTMTGDLTLAGTGVGRSVIFDTTDARQRRIDWKTGGVMRWSFFASTDDDLYLNRTPDGGAATQTIRASRATGNLSFGTAAPDASYRLRLSVGNAAEVGSGIAIDNANNDPLSSGDILFRSGGGLGSRARIRGGRSPANSLHGRLTFSTWAGSTESQVLALDSDKSATFEGNASFYGGSVTVTNSSGDPNLTLTRPNVRSWTHYVGSGGEWGLYDQTGAATRLSISVSGDLTAGGAITSPGGISGASFTGDRLYGNGGAMGRLHGSAGHAMGLGWNTASAVAAPTIHADSTVVRVCQGINANNLQMASGGSGPYLALVDNSGNAFGCNAFSSDARLKVDITDAEIDAEAVIAALQVRAFTWSNPAYGQGRVPAGFIAQEVQDVLPCAVFSVGEGEEAHRAITPLPLIAALVADAQAKAERIAQLEGLVEGLAARVAALEGGAA